MPNTSALKCVHAQVQELIGTVRDAERVRRDALLEVQYIERDGHIRLLSRSSRVDTVKELATRRPANLAATLVGVNEEKKLTRMVPPVKVVTDWSPPPSRPSVREAAGGSVAIEDTPDITPPAVHALLHERDVLPEFQQRE